MSSKINAGSDGSHEIKKDTWLLRRKAMTNLDSYCLVLPSPISYSAFDKYLLKTYLAEHLVKDEVKMLSNF